MSVKIPNHDEIIREKMGQLANITKQAETRITGSILSNASSGLRDAIGTDEYDSYLELLDSYLVIIEISPEVPGDPVIPAVLDSKYNVFDNTVYSKLTDKEKSLRNLIHAEAYLGLYYLATALKKLVKGSVNTSREAAGGASIQASPFSEIIENMELYQDEAMVCISSALGEDIDSGYFDGKFGVFVV